MPVSDPAPVLWDKIQAPARIQIRAGAVPVIPCYLYSS